MSKMSEELAMRILSGDILGTKEQEEEAIKMGVAALYKIIEVKKL